MKVTVEVVQKKYLRLSWSWQGQTYRLSLGVHDSPTARAYANQKAALIYSDILSGHFDSSLLKYKSRGGKNGTEISAVELWRRYTKAMIVDKGLSCSAQGRYAAIATHLKTVVENLSAEKLNDGKAKAVAAYLSERCSGSTTKQYIWLLASAWDWARGQFHIAASNPWRTPLERVKPSAPKRAKPFTQDELDRILAAFRENKHYQYYFPMVLFLAAIGCRPGEAIALKWGSISPDFQTVEIDKAANRQGEIKSTKNHKSRTVLLPTVMSRVLSGLYEARSPRPADLVFPAMQGGLLDDKRLARVWRKVLAAAGVPFRRIYTLRHSAISRALAAGYSATDIAGQTGHLPRTLLTTYAHAMQPNVFEFRENIALTRSSHDESELTSNSSKD